MTDSGLPLSTVHSLGIARLPHQSFEREVHDLHTLTRRAAIGAIATLPAIGGAVAASADPDRELLALGAEFEARWAAEGVALRIAYGPLGDRAADAAHDQALARTAKAYMWCRGEAPGKKIVCGPGDMTTDDDVLAQLINSLLGDAEQANV
ncbi:hypothetical protein [Mesorhizobium sp. WSM3876]|uniref:hypothetical protein n=1 Tax=Mesorhizobium sp. WSM3876 TaxID=422277 RepID=UPI001140F580|nr:hypothetical protein [Mesorhizobium sp. WSM3876]